MKRLFFGGVHPNDKKEMSLSNTDLVTITPEKVIIPLSQHIGNLCTPLVAVGDYVLKGQKIGDGEGICVPVHASVSGSVTEICEHPHPSGKNVLSIVIENDFKNQSLPFSRLVQSIKELDFDTTLGKIHSAGIVGMGGAAFPSNVKSLSALGKVETLIANACECEPYITSDDTLIQTDTESVFCGMAILSQLLSCENTVIAIENNKTLAIKKLQELQEKYPTVKIKVLPTAYPQGGEKQLVQAVTGRQIPPKGLPINVGAVVFNVSTFSAIYNAVMNGIPLIQRIVTVTGEAVKKPQNFIVPIGTPFSDIIKAAGGLKCDNAVIINGGPMMGMSQITDKVPAVKATNAVVCLVPDVKNEKYSDCIRCGKCLSVCPMRLQPVYINKYAKIKDIKMLDKLNVVDCMECGSCAYSCPAKLPLVDGCREGKKLLKESDLQ